MKKIFILILVTVVFSCTNKYIVNTDGVKSTFNSGVIYRYEGMSPMLEVEGNYYEMGLQYGVLLKPEIIASVKSFDKIFEMHAEMYNIPNSLFRLLLKKTTKRLSKNLPKGYLQEIKGISKGSGISISKILMITLSYDALNSMACTSVLMRGDNGTIIHGRNNDTAIFGGPELGILTVIVKYKLKGFNEVTHTDYPLFMGIQTAYNSQGLTVSEQTYNVKNPIDGGFSYSYLIRMILETENTLTGVFNKAKEYSTTGGHGVVWSDKKTGEGILIEMINDNIAVIDINQSIFWNLNHALTDEIKKYEEVNSGDREREIMASSFKVIDEYSIYDSIEFLRLKDIGNRSTQQSIIFHPTELGLYIAVGKFKASSNSFYYINDDFSVKPEVLTF